MNYIDPDEMEEIIYALEGCRDEDCTGCYLEDNPNTCACKKTVAADAAKALKVAAEVLRVRQKKEDDKKVLYLCDQRACENCNPKCHHTEDIQHATNFKHVCNAAWEIDASLHGMQKEIIALKEEVEGLKNLQEWGIVP